MLKKGVFYIIITIVSVLIICLIAVQMYWMRGAYRLQQVNFNEKVNSVLNKAVSYTEDISFSFYLYARAYISAGEGVTLLKTRKGGHEAPDTVKLFNAFAYPDHPGDSCFYATSTSYYDAPTLVNVALKFESWHKAVSIPDMRVKNNELQNLTFNNFRKQMNENIPITQRIRLEKLDSMLRVLLKQQGIHAVYAFGLRKSGTAVFEYISDPRYAGKLDNAFSTIMFENIPYTTPYELALYIDNKDRFISKSLMAGLGISLAVIGMLAAAFVYFSHTVLYQKKLSEMKTSFINNMTHEFMTPVTNISLALETIEKTKDNPDIHDRIMQLIANENEHLKENIDKVMQIAVLEKRSFLLNVTPLDIHAILGRVIKSFAMQLEKKGGRFELDLNAPDPVVAADETHIINLFYNIIDNAVKYSAEERKPVIKISTGNANKKLWVSIADNGIGMTPEIQKHMFNKFYRGAKGDKHDVKGFGLGLSYVKSIADAHGITIDVKSTINKDTIFTIWFNKYIK